MDKCSASPDIRPRRRTLRVTLSVSLAVPLLLLSASAVASPTYYVDASNGNDVYTASQAQNPATPWKTIKRAVSTGGLFGMTSKGVVLAGYTVVVQPGIYMESVESKRDGLSSDPVTIRAATRGAVTILPPPATNGFFVSHHYHVIDGFIVTGGNIGIRLGAHDGGDGPVNGVVAQYNQVSGNSNNGIQFANAQNGIAAFNTIYQNGQDGINYEGNGSAIHDNTVHDNGRFGIYVKDGTNHQVWNNAVYNNAGTNIKVDGSQIAPPGGRTFYVGAGGNDGYSDVQAQNPQTPWATFSKALGIANPGDTVAALPGVYAVTVQSVRDGTPAQPITITAAQPGTVTIHPPSGSGMYIGHHYHVVQGLVITGANTGLQMGPYKGTSGQVNGLAALNNVVYGNGPGIKFTNVTTASAMHNVVYGNTKDGIAYTWANQSSCPAGSGATIFNNLVYGNGSNLSGEYGITVGCGDSNQVINNTLYGNLNGGIRLGVSGSVPVLGSVLNNIVVGSPVGFKEPAGDGYTGQVTLDFNDAYANTQNYGLGPLTKAGPGSISVTPGFVDATGGDFRLGRLATGQPADSGVIDKGSDTASAVGLGGRTAFTDKYPDVVRVDLGYHGTALYPSQGPMTVSQAALTFDQIGGVGFTFSGNLKPGAGSDGMNPGVDYAEVTFGDLDLLLWTAGYQQQGAVSATLQKQADGGVDFTIQATGLSLSSVKFPTSVGLRIGDDFGSATVLLTGSLHTP
jgi:parallel beta-helix repeat protein